jgi:phosphohistidine swiveling domain-containing protein
MLDKTKAQNLRDIQKKIRIVPFFKIYRFKKFLDDTDCVLNEIKNKFRSGEIAIRSSFKNEDNKNSSNAGKYLTFLNIKSKNIKDVKEKILKIISYRNNNRDLDNEFFVQDMVKNIKFSGVLLTKSINNHNIYYDLNYFEGSDSTAVTSGKNKTKRIIYIKNSKYKIDKIFLNLINYADKIKKITKENNLDIEFAIDKNKKTFILQVRKLVIKETHTNSNDSKNNIYRNLEKKIIKLQKRNHNLSGKTTYFGVMPDWNPAEIIGIKPRPLSLSLYQELITNQIWAQNRKIYGYKDLSQFPLMTTFYGTPYIDIRVDFNSWIPKNINPKLSEKITNYYLNKLKKHKYYHDKVEFEILFTCYSLNSEKKIRQLLSKEFSKNEQENLIKELKTININALKKIQEDISLIEELKKKQNLINNSNRYTIDKIYWLIQDCKKYGTLPFAGIARCAFISMEILNSFVKEKIITEKEKIEFLGTINTITTELKKDIHKDKKIFIKKYGHLRPGTYEITSNNYKKDFNKYFDKKNIIKINKKKNFLFSKKQKKQINSFINKHKIYKSLTELIKFIKISIEYREYAKFIFTKSIDLIFHNLEKFGKKFKINICDLSFIEISHFIQMHNNLADVDTIKKIKNIIEQNKKQYEVNKNIHLPEIIFTPRDVYLNKLFDSKINYISNKIIIGNITKITKNNFKKSIKDKIVCIENADPGYDFLFSKNIKGIITKYGGQNSHMAIRCAEMNMPGLIGVGEKNFEILSNANKIRIDCNAKKFEILGGI